jgi:hypothetical protein
VAEDYAFVELGPRQVNRTAGVGSLELFCLFQALEGHLEPLLLLVKVGFRIEGEALDDAPFAVGGRDHVAVSLDLPEELCGPLVVVCVSKRHLC